MSGIIAVYGLVISVLIAGQVKPPPDQNTSLYEYVHHIPTQNWPDLVRSWILTEDIQRIHALGSRAVCWARRRSCRVYNRDCGRCGMPFFFYLAPNVSSFCIHCCAWFLTGLFFFAGCACLHAAIASLRRNDTHFDFRRSSRSLRVSFYLPRWGRVHLITEKQSDRRVDSELEELKSPSFGYVFDIIHYQGCQLVADPSLRLL